MKLEVKDLEKKFNNFNAVKKSVLRLRLGRHLAYWGLTVVEKQLL